MEKEFLDRLKDAMKTSYELYEELTIIKAHASYIEDPVLSNRLSEAMEQLEVYAEALADIVTPQERAKDVLGKLRLLIEDSNKICETAKLADDKKSVSRIEEAIFSLEDAETHLEGIIS